MASIFVTTGKAICSNRMFSAGTEPKWIGWGTAAGTAAIGDTTLFTEKDVDLSGAGPARTAGTSSQVTTTLTNDTHQIVGTRTATGAGTVTNAGVFDAVSGGNLYLKGDFTGIGLAISDSITFTFALKFA